MDDPFHDRLCARLKHNAALCELLRYDFHARPLNVGRKVMLYCISSHIASMLQAASTPSARMFSWVSRYSAWETGWAPT